jgi:hypothetical protein
MKKYLLLLPFVFVLAACQNNDDGIDHNAVAKAQGPLKAAAVRAGGDWSKLSADEQKLFLTRARGNENTAKMLVGMFGSGPPGRAPKP